MPWGSVPMRPGTSAPLAAAKPATPQEDAAARRLPAIALPTLAQRRVGLDLSDLSDLRCHAPAWLGQRCRLLRAGADGKPQPSGPTGRVAALANINDRGHARLVVIAWDDGHPATTHLLAEIWREG